MKDLRFGALLDSDWTGVDLDDDFLTGRPGEVPFRAHAQPLFHRRHHDQEPTPTPLGLDAGDLLVQFHSASGTDRWRWPDCHSTSGDTTAAD